MILNITALVLVLKISLQANTGSTSSSSGSSGGATCQWPLLNAYGLNGLNKPSQQKHMYCQGIQSNCCSEEDQKMSMQLWNQTNWVLIEKYYYLYAIMVKYILGYVTETFILSQSYKEGENSQCQQVFQDLNQLNVGYTQLNNIYTQIVLGLNAMGNLRSTFYCALCDGNNQDNYSNRNIVENFFYTNRLYFSQEFCQNLVDKTIQANYYKLFYLQWIANSTSKIINCKAGDPVQTYQTGFIDKQIVMNCQTYQGKYFFFFCEYYCQQYHFTKTTEAFDGEISSLKLFVTQIMKFWQKIFNDPENNTLMYFLTYEEDMMNMYMTQFQDEQSFFPVSTNISFNNYKTDVLLTGGMNPYTHVGKNSYNITFTEGVGFEAVMIGVLCLLFFL